MRVVVTVCTCRRPDSLERLLRTLSEIDFKGVLSVIIVENDDALQGLQRCRDLADKYRWPLHCVVERTAGISHARNRAVVEALRLRPDLIAMLDDDEWPDWAWLAELMRVQRTTGADIVGGPVVPDLAAGEAEFCRRYRQHYGLDQNLADGSPCVLFGTGNFIARVDCFEALMPEPFDPGFARSGILGEC